MLDIHCIFALICDHWVFNGSWVPSCVFPLRYGLLWTFMIAFIWSHYSLSARLIAQLLMWPMRHVHVLNQLECYSQATVCCMQYMPKYIIETFEMNVNYINATFYMDSDYLYNCMFPCPILTWIHIESIILFHVFRSGFRHKSYTKSS